MEIPISTLTPAVQNNNVVHKRAKRPSRKKNTCAGPSGIKRYAPLLESRDDLVPYIRNCASTLRVTADELRETLCKTTLQKHAKLAQVISWKSFSV